MYLGFTNKSKHSLTHGLGRYGHSCGAAHNVLCYYFHVKQEADYPVHEQIDLYDDVISPSANNGDAPEDRDYLDTLPAPGGTEGGKTAPPNVVYTYTGKRIALYIGNLTWVGIRQFCSGSLYEAQSNE